MSSAIYIIFGLLLTFIVYFLIAWGLSSLFFLISKEQVTFLRNVQVTASLAGAGFLVNILGMIALSGTNFYVFAVIVTLVGFGTYFALLKYFWKFNNFDAIILASTLAVLMNLSWLRLIGVLS